MSLANLKREIYNFSRSSTYRFGDQTSFCVRLGKGLFLPGQCDPNNYLDALGLKTLPERVMIVCPGNGGLITECFNRGAKHVIAVEPRPRFRQSLLRVLKFLDQVWSMEGITDRQHTLVYRWPEANKSRGYEDVNLILWPEGINDITTPKLTFAGLADCLTPGGNLYVEVWHGNHSLVDQINSWRPTGHAMKEVALNYFGKEWYDTVAGRLGSKVYILRSHKEHSSNRSDKGKLDKSDKQKTYTKEKESNLQEDDREDLVVLLGQSEAAGESSTISAPSTSSDVSKSPVEADAEPESKSWWPRRKKKKATKKTGSKKKTSGKKKKSSSSKKKKKKKKTE